MKHSEKHYQQFIEANADNFYRLKIQQKQSNRAIVGSFFVASLIIALLYVFFSFSGYQAQAYIWSFMICMFLWGLFANDYILQYRNLFKEHIIAALVKEYHPQLHFQYKKKGVFGYAQNISKWDKYSSLRAKNQDFIEGEIGRTEFCLFETKLSGKTPKRNSEYVGVFNGIVVHLKNPPRHIRAKEIFDHPQTRKAFNKIFDNWKNNYPEIVEAKDGSWYILYELNPSKLFLEPLLYAKSFNKDMIERLTNDFYLFLQAIEVINQLFEQQDLKIASEDPSAKIEIEIKEKQSIRKEWDKENK